MRYQCHWNIFSSFGCAYEYNNNKCSAVANMGDCLDMGRKLGAVPLFGGSLVPISHNMASADAFLRTKWHLDPSNHMTTTDIGQKFLEGEGSWVPI